MCQLTWNWISFRTWFAPPIDTINYCRSKWRYQRSLTSSYWNVVKITGSCCSPTRAWKWKRFATISSVSHRTKETTRNETTRKTRHIIFPSILRAVKLERWYAPSERNTQIIRAEIVVVCRSWPIRRAWRLFPVIRDPWSVNGSLSVNTVCTGVIHTGSPLRGFSPLSLSLSLHAHTYTHTSLTLPNMNMISHPGHLRNDLSIEHRQPWGTGVEIL